MEINDSEVLHDYSVHSLLIQQHEKHIAKIREKLHESSNTMLEFDFSIKHISESLQHTVSVLEDCNKRLSALEIMNKERLFKLSLFSRFVNNKYTWIAIIVLLLSVDHNHAWRVINQFISNKSLTN